MNHRHHDITMKMNLLFGCLCLQVLIATSSGTIGNSLNLLPAGGSSTVTTYNIYSKITGKFMQVRRRKVDANGECGSKYAKMEVSSLGFNGQITIRSYASKRYLCFSRKGRLITRVRRSQRNCAFNQPRSSNYYDTFQSVRYSNWYIGFNRNGRAKKGPKTKAGQTAVELLKHSKDCRGQQTTTDKGQSTYLNENEWKEIADRFYSEISNGMKSETMQGDDPMVLNEDPFDIQKELDKRRKIAMGRLDQNDKKIQKSVKKIAEKKRRKKKKKPSSNLKITSKGNNNINFISGSENHTTETDPVLSRPTLLPKMTSLSDSSPLTDRRVHKPRRTSRTHSKRKKQERGPTKRPTHKR